MTRSSKKTLTLAASASALLFVPAVHGATQVWNGAAGDLSFNTAGNWSPALPGNSDIAQFKDSGYNSGDTVAVNADITINRLAFNWSTNQTSINLTIGGTNTITLAPASAAQGFNRTSNVAGVQTINANLLLAADQQWNVAGAGGASGANPASNRVVINGSVGETGGSFGFNKTGDHVLELNGNNTFTGNVTVVANALIIGNNNALGLGTNPVYLGPVSGTNTNTPTLVTKSGVTLARDIEIKSGGGGAARIGGANGQTSSVWSGNVAINRDFTVTGGYGSQSGVVDFLGVLADGNDPNNAFVSSNLTKADGGTVRLFGADTYSGSTTVNAGTLLVNGSLSAAASAVNVNNKGRLGGTGTIGRAVNVATGGILSPGDNGPGALTVNNGQAVTLTDGSVYEWQAGATPATSDTLLADQLNLTGSPTLKILPSSATPDASATYVLASWTGADPTNLPAWNVDTTNGWTGNVSYVGADDGQPGGEVVLTGVSAVSSTPEPGSLSLVGVVGAALVGRRRRAVQNARRLSRGLWSPRAPRA